MSKSGNFLLFLSIKISTFHKIKTRPSIKILRNASLHLYLMNACWKFEKLLLKSERDIHAQKMLVENQIFVFPDYYFSKFSMHFYLLFSIR